MNTFGIEVDGEYGDGDAGAVRLMDGDEELVMWDIAEWKEDPSLVFVIANTIRTGYEEGSDEIRSEGGPDMTETEQASAELQRLLQLRWSTAAGIEQLALKLLAVNLRGRWKTAAYLALHEGDQSETDVTAGALRDADGNDLGLDTGDDDEVIELIMQLETRRLDHHPLVKKFGGRHSPVWTLDLVKAEQLPMPEVD